MNYVSCNVLSLRNLFNVGFCSRLLLIFFVILITEVQANLDIEMNRPISSTKEENRRFNEKLMKPNQPSSVDLVNKNSQFEISEGVVGVVLNQDGKPLANVLVQAIPIGSNSGPVPEIAILTNNEGRYVWPLQPGRYELTISPSGLDQITKDVIVSSGTVTSLNFEYR